MTISTAQILDHLYESMIPIAINYFAASRQPQLSAVSELEDTLSFVEFLKQSYLPKNLSGRLTKLQTHAKTKLSEEILDTTSINKSYVEGRARQLTRNLLNPWVRWVDDRAVTSVTKWQLLDPCLRPWDPDEHTRFDARWSDLAQKYGLGDGAAFEMMQIFGAQYVRDNKAMLLPSGESVIVHTRTKDLDYPLFFATTPKNVIELNTALLKAKRLNQMRELAKSVSAQWSEAIAGYPGLANQSGMVSPGFLMNYAQKNPQASAASLALVGATHQMVCNYVSTSQSEETIVPNYLYVSPVEKASGFRGLGFECEVRFQPGSPSQPYNENFLYSVESSFENLADSTSFASSELERVGVSVS